MYKRDFPVGPTVLLLLTLHLVTAGLAAQDFNAQCDRTVEDDFNANNPAGSTPTPGSPVPYLPVSPIPGSDWGAWFFSMPERLLADFDLVDGPGASSFSLAYQPQGAAPFGPFSVRLIGGAPTLLGGIAIWRFRASWEFRFNGFGMTNADYEQMRVGLGGNKTQLGCTPGRGGQGLEFLGFSSRVQTRVCDVPPCTPAMERNAMVLGQLPAAFSALQIFAENNDQELGAELMYSPPPPMPPPVFDFEVVLDLDLGIFDVHMSTDGGPMVDVGGYRMVEDVGCGSAYPSRLLDLLYVAFDGHGLDGLDAFRMDDLRIEHWVDANTQSCGDVNGNETVDIVDVLMIVQQSAGLRADAVVDRLGDVNRDGDVLIDDALRTALFLNGEDLPLLCTRTFNIMPPMPPCP